MKYIIKNPILTSIILATLCINYIVAVTSHNIVQTSIQPNTTFESAINNSGLWCRSFV